MLQVFPRVLLDACPWPSCRWRPSQLNRLETLSSVRRTRRPLMRGAREALNGQGWVTS
jgi:hypothetical protein